MVESFVPSLERLSCEKVVMCLLDDTDLQWRTKSEYQAAKSKVTVKISSLMPCELLQRKLEAVIAPILFGIQDMRADLENNWKGLDAQYYVGRVIPKCRLLYGTIDKEKCISMVIEDEDINPLDRFIMACVFCMFENVPELWNSLNRIEKAFFRNRGSKNTDIVCTIFGHWIEWLEGNREGGWQSFAARTLETPIWKYNTFILKRVLGTVSPSEKSQYLLKAVSELQVNSDMMWFCLSMMTEDEREEVYRTNPLQVFRCILSWPLRHLFDDFANKLWPYVTDKIFFSTLTIILGMIRDEGMEHVELVVIMKTFWARGPDHYKKFVQDDSKMFKKFNYVLQHDLSKPFNWSSFFHYSYIGMGAPFPF